MKVFTAVYKRIYRSLSEEFQKLYRLNAVYLNEATYVDVVDMEIGPKDFDVKNNNIYPGADPTSISQTERLMKAQGLMELMPSGVLNPVKVVTRILEAQEQPNYQELLIPQVAQTGEMPPPPPDPKLQEMQMKGQLEQQKMASQQQQMERKSQLEASSAQAKLSMKAQEHQLDMQAKQQQLQLAAAEAQHKQRIFSAEAQQKMIAGQMQTMQKVHQTHELGKAKAEAIRHQAKAKPSKGSK
jgi:hypothetical protein